MNTRRTIVSVVGGLSIFILGLALVGTSAQAATSKKAKNNWPITYTLDSSNVTSNSATLNGLISGTSLGSDQVWFEYGNNFTDGNYASSWPWSAGSQTITGTYQRKISTTITGLQANTLYYYHIKAVNRNGQNGYGPGIDISFRTLPASGSNNSNSNNSGNSNSSCSNYCGSGSGYSSSMYWYQPPTTNYNYNNYTTTNTTNNTTNNTSNYTSVVTTTNNTQNNSNYYDYYTYQNQQYLSQNYDTTNYTTNNTNNNTNYTTNTNNTNNNSYSNNYTGVYSYQY
jgi:hypothetical protein